MTTTTNASNNKKEGNRRISTTSNGSKLPAVTKSIVTDSARNHLNHSNNSTYNNNNDNDTMDRNVAQLHPTIVQDMIPYIICCIAILHGIYMYFYNVYAHNPTMFFGALRIPSPQDCVILQQKMEEIDSSNSHNEKCGRPDLFAFQMVSGIVFVVVSVFGLHAWYHHRIKNPTTSTAATTKRYLLTTPASRLYGYQYESHIILIINLSYQVWDFIISVAVIPEYCTTIMLLHHVVAALVAYYGLHNYMFSYYSVFFLGLSEVSSIFLVSLDLHKYFISSESLLSSSSSNALLPSLLSNLFFVYSQHVAGPLFVVSFIYYRIVLWYSVSKRLWDDVHYVTATTTISTTNTTATNSSSTTPTATAIKESTTTSLAEQLRPHRTYVLYIWLYANLPMGVLQLYFLSIIIYEIHAKFF